MLRELPPTSGLPPRLSDLFGRASDDALEVGLAALLDCPGPQVECSGTASLLIALEYLKSRSPRRSIIVPAFTCPLVALAGAKAGLNVIPCDIARGRFDLDEAHLQQLMGPDILCVIATHLGGWLTDVARLRAILSPEVIIIEDAAQAFGARQNQRPVGFAGDIGFFSFALGKGFTIYEGGALVANDPAIRAGLQETARRLHQPQRIDEYWRCLEFAVFHFLYNKIGLRLIYGTSRNYWLRRGDYIRAIGDYFDNEIALHPVSRWRKAVGSRSLARFPAHLAATAASRDLLIAALAKIEGLDLHLSRPGDAPSSFFALASFPTQQQCDAALDVLWASTLGVSKLFAHALGDYDYLAGKLVPTATPHARDLAARTLTITTSPWLGAADIAKIVSGIAEGMAHSG